MLNVLKASGKMERFKPEKVKKSILRAGVSSATAEEVVKEIEKRAYDGITTREIFRLAMKLLKEMEPSSAMRYDLKGAIMRLGPAGFSFETYVSEILREYGYKTKLRVKLTGRCVPHEVDIVATDTSGKRFMVECKYHNALGTYTNLKEALYTYARFLDLVEGHRAGKGERFDAAMLSCNTRTSLDVQRYAACIGMRLLCWRYPKDTSLEKLIEGKNLYPITILPSVDIEAQQKLSRAGIVLAKSLLEKDLDYVHSRTGLKAAKLQRIVEDAAKIARVSV